MALDVENRQLRHCTWTYWRALGALLDEIYVLIELEHRLVEAETRSAHPISS